MLHALLISMPDISAIVSPAMKLSPHPVGSPISLSLTGHSMVIFPLFIVHPFLPFVMIRLYASCFVPFPHSCSLGVMAYTGPYFIRFLSFGSTSINLEQQCTSLHNSSVITPFA